MKTKVMTFAMLMALLGISSCSKTDLYDPNKVAELEAAKQEKLAEEYGENFIKTYGEINPNQSWDYSNNDEYFVIPSSSAAPQAMTRGAAASYTMSKSQSYYQVQQATLDKMHEVFKEGEDNRALGTPFAMTVPSNDFTIMPIFMGQSGGDFDLYMHVDGVGEILVWRKWEDMQAKFTGMNGWQNLYTEERLYFMGLIPTSYVIRKSINNGDNTVKATAIQSKYINFKGLPVGANMYFYLKITSAADGYNKKGESLGSINNYMREYKFAENDLPTDLPGVKKPEMKIIGCEDASTQKGDNDFNDVVFMIYGEPYVPQSFEVTNLEKVVKKRYMIEDLGSTNDTDFNDIVFDVVSTYTFKQTTSASGVVAYSDEEVKSREVQVKALGGTLDFELSIGGKTWKKSDDFDAKEMINTKEPDYTKVLHSFPISNDWNPESNDVVVTVAQKDGNQSTVKVTFPLKGSVPMIIATDATVKWSVERKAFDFSKCVWE